MPGLVKIGRSEFPIEQRLRQLDSTSIPLPFECFYAAEIENAAEVEKSLHTAFGDHRIRASREFFRISPDKPVVILKLLEKKNVTPSIDIVESASDQEALDAERRRRSNFSFESVGIRPGTVLVSVFDEQETCVVKDKRWIVFRGEEDSLSSAALKIAHEKGFAWKAVQGPAYSKWEGSTLAELREAAEDASSEAG
jgi:hypothetical protein